MKFAPLVSLVFFAGCFSSAPKPPVAWNLDADTALAVSSVTVNSPYDGTRFAVLRPDGSIAFDSFNVFSARPVSLVRAAVLNDPDGPELVVRRLALDCRQDGERKALVELHLRTSRSSLGRSEASVSAADGDYSKAFSAAFAAAASKLVSRDRR